MKQKPDQQEEEVRIPRNITTSKSVRRSQKYSKLSMQEAIEDPVLIVRGFILGIL